MKEDYDDDTDKSIEDNSIGNNDVDLEKSTPAKTDQNDKLVRKVIDMLNQWFFSTIVERVSYPMNLNSIATKSNVRLFLCEQVMSVKILLL